MRPRTELAPVDQLGRLIQTAIDDLVAEGELQPPDDWEARYDGYCARACQAYKFLARDPRTRDLAADPDFEVRSRRDGRESHYWLSTSAGVMDLIYGPGEEPDPRYPYASSRKGHSPGFNAWKADPRYPHRKDSRKIVDRVWEHVEIQ